MLLSPDRIHLRRIKTPPDKTEHPAPPVPTQSLFVSAAGHRLAAILAASGIPALRPATSGTQLALYP